MPNVSLQDATSKLLDRRKSWGIFSHRIQLLSNISLKQNIKRKKPTYFKEMSVCIRQKELYFASWTWNDLSILVLWKIAIKSAHFPWKTVRKRISYSELIFATQCVTVIFQPWYTALQHMGVEVWEKKKSLHFPTCIIVQVTFPENIWWTLGR